MLKKHLVTTLLIGSFLVAVGSASAAEITVQKGNSLWSIANKYNTTVSKLMEINGLKSDLLQIGQVLQLPGEKEEPPETASADPAAEDSKDLASRNQTRMDSLVKYAASLLGCKYRYGGETPKGFDCSGFVRYVYKQFGVSLDHSSASQFSSLPQKVDKKDLSIGDLVFFASGKTINHVGIYIGNNEFIHSSTPKTGVIISGLAESYYSARYKGARRVTLTKDL